MDLSFETCTITVETPQDSVGSTRRRMPSPPCIARKKRRLEDCHISSSNVIRLVRYNGLPLVPDDFEICDESLSCEDVPNVTLKPRFEDRQLPRIRAVPRRRRLRKLFFQEEAREEEADSRSNGQSLQTVSTPRGTPNRDFRRPLFFKSWTQARDLPPGDDVREGLWMPSL